MSVRTMYRIHGDEIDFVVVEIPVIPVFVFAN